MTTEIILRSFTAAIITSLISSYLGVYLAWRAYIGTSLSASLKHLLIVLFCTPTHVYAISILLCVNSSSQLSTAFSVSLASFIYSYIGIILILIITNLPIAFLFCENIIKTTNLSYFELAHLNNCSQIVVFLRILLPIIKGEIYKLKLLIFLNTIGSYSIPYLLGRSKQIEFITTYLVKKLKNLSADSAEYIELLAISSSLISVIIFVTLIRRNDSKASLLAYENKNNTQPLIEYGLFDKFLNTMILAILFILTISPMLMILIYSFNFNTNSNMYFSYQNYLMLFRNENLFLLPIIRTITYTLLISVILLPLGILYTFYKKKCDSIFIKFISFASFFIYLLPGILIAILFMMFVGTFETQILGINCSILVCYCIKFFSPICQFISSLSDRISVVQLNQGYVYTQSSLLIIKKIFFPIVVKATVPCILIILGLTIKELSISMLLSDYDSLLVGQSILEMIDSAEFGLASAYSVVLLLLVWGIFLSLENYVSGNKRRYQTS